MFLSQYDMNDFFNDFFPVSFGAGSAGIFAVLTYNNIVGTIVLASIGAVVGYLMKKLLDWIFKYIQKKRRESKKNKEE